MVTLGRFREALLSRVGVVLTAGPALSVPGAESWLQIGYLLASPLPHSLPSTAFTENTLETVEAWGSGHVDGSEHQGGS